MSIITDVKNPRWANAEHSKIDLDVIHSEYGEVPFTASPDDPEKHGRVLYQAALAGEFGNITEYAA